jgi:hypothetical protein
MMIQIGDVIRIIGPTEASLVSNQGRLARVRRTYQVPVMVSMRKANTTMALEVELMEGPDEGWTQMVYASDVDLMRPDKPFGPQSRVRLASQNARTASEFGPEVGTVGVYRCTRPEEADGVYSVQWDRGGFGWYDRRDLVEVYR